MKNIAILTIVLILAGCSPQRRLASLLERFPLDTIRTTETIYRDTIIEVPIAGDTTYIETVIEIPYEVIDSSGSPIPFMLNVSPLHFEVELAWSEVWVENNILKSLLVQKDSILKIKLDSAILENKTVERIPYPEYIQPKPFYKNGFFILAGLILVSLILLLVLLKR